MRGRPYFEAKDYQSWLISRQRRELFPLNSIMSQINWKKVSNFLDFGMGHGYFSQAILERLPKDGWLWGAECQEEIIDQVLKKRKENDLNRFTVFFMERTEHPLLPDWIPDPDIIFCSCVLSTFADPSLAIAGIGRKMTNEGSMYLLDWERIESPHPPQMRYKISENRMKYSIAEAGYEVVQKFNTNSWLYFLELKKGQKAKDEKNQYAYLNYS